MDQMENNVITVKKRRGRPPKKNTVEQQKTTSIDGEPKKKLSRRKNVTKSNPLVISYDRNSINTSDNTSYACDTSTIYTGASVNLIVELKIGEKDIKRHEEKKAIEFEEHMFDHEVIKNDVGNPSYYGIEMMDEKIPNAYNKLKKDLINVDTTHGKQIADKYLRNEYELLKEQLHVKNTSNTETIPLKWKRIKLSKDMIIYNGNEFSIKTHEHEHEHNHKYKHEQRCELIHANSPLIVSVPNSNYENNCKHIKIQFMKTHKPKGNTIPSNDALMMVSDLPDKTDIVCWNDHHHFDGKQVMIPMEYENGTYFVFGNFCSFSCALRYLYDKYKYSTVYEELHSLLHMMYMDTHIINDCNTKISDLVIAPEISTLCSHGGIYTLQQYREYGSNSVICDIHMPNIVALNYQIEEIYTNARSNKKFIPVDLSEVNKSTIRMNKKENMNITNTYGIEMQQIDLHVVEKTDKSDQEVNSINDILSEQLSLSNELTDDLISDL